MGETSTALPAAGFSFRTIGELAERCGHYCWLENRLFELSGSWASAPGAGDPEIRVFLSEISARHGFLAAQWADRLPVRSGIDPAALVIAPSERASDAFDLLESDSELPVRLGGLVEEFLPRLLGAYRLHLAGASPVAEAPVRTVLETAIGGGEQETRRGRGLALRALRGTGEEGRLAALTSRLQPLLDSATGIFPAAWAS